MAAAVRAGGGEWSGERMNSSTNEKDLREETPTHTKKNKKNLGTHVGEKRVTFDFSPLNFVSSACKKMQLPRFPPEDQTTPLKIYSLPPLRHILSLFSQAVVEGEEKRADRSNVLHTREEWGKEEGEEGVGWVTR